MAAAKKSPGRRLGRGLGSLIGTPVAVNPPAPAAPESSGPSLTATPSAPTTPAGFGDAGVSGGGVRMLKLETLRPNPRQPRQRFAPEAIKSLADSIRTAGLMQPMGVHLQPMQPMHLPLSLVAPCSDPDVCSATAV